MNEASDKQLVNPIARRLKLSSTFSDCKCGAKTRSNRNQNCGELPSDAPVDNPNLAIYSQDEVYLNGNTPTWDSPDIITNNWRPFRLLNEATIKVRNLSATVPAINTLVHYFISPFGIGTKKELKLTQRVNVPASAEIEIVFPLHQSTLNGDPRVGVHIVIEHPHDSDLANNKGSQVHDGGYTTESGRSFDVIIPVHNNTNSAQKVELSVLQTDITTLISPSSIDLSPFEQSMSTLNIEIPNSIHGAFDNALNKSVTVIGKTDTGILLGGITRLIRVDD